MARTGTVIPKGLNLRATPGGAVMKVLPKGTIVEILETENGTFKVNANGDVGFVAADFIQQNPVPGDTAAAPVDSVSAPAPATGGAFRFVNNKAVAPDGTVYGNKSGKGISNIGKTSIGDFVSANPGAFAALSPSRVRVMSAVSVNEGMLEAINTYDNSFLTFGCFQWTVGAGADPGELPAMVNRLKQTNPEAFHRLLGQFGLDVASVKSPPGQTPTGFFSLNGAVIKSPADKQNKLRTMEMAFRFYRAGQDPAMRQVQIEYAASRIDLFYREPNHKIRNLFIADFVSSEFGVALLLDQHVNRPGHVPKTLAEAVNEFIAAGAKSDPATWNDQDEANLLNIYIKRRAKTTMTDSTKRADRIRQAVSKGLASAQRGSFQP
jgi:SH3 domain-containing protein